MYTLTIINDEHGNWKRDLAHRLPHYYNLVVLYSSGDQPPVEKRYTIIGLDEREFGTEGEALQEARIKLKLEPKPRPYTQEQRDAMDEYGHAISRYQHAAMLVSEGVFNDGPDDTNTALNLQSRRDEVRRVFLICRGLGIDFAGPESGGGVSGSASGEKDTCC